MELKCILQSNYLMHSKGKRKVMAFQYLNISQRSNHLCMQKDADRSQMALTIQPDPVWTLHSITSSSCVGGRDGKGGGMG